MNSPPGEEGNIRESVFNNRFDKLLFTTNSIIECKLNKQFRLEAEYYNSPFTELSSYFEGLDIIQEVQYGTSKELNELGIGYPILRLNEFDSYFIATPSKFCDLISTDVYNSLKLQKNDVLICRTNGNPKLVGKAALVPKNYEYAYASYLFKIRPNKELINSATLVSYLNSKYGRVEIEKQSMVSNQANFSPAKFKEILVPKFTVELNNKVENLVFEAFELLEISHQTYHKAETLLLETLGLKDFKPSREKVNVKTFKDSFIQSGRLDAEYYQVKYEDYIHLIKSYENGWECLSRLCLLKDKNFVPEDNLQYKYIELSNIGKSGEINNCTNASGKVLPSRARRLVETGDVIISSIEGSLESCAIVPEAFDNAICSTGFYVVNSAEINSETLLVLFKSETMQNILKQNCSGTILTALNKDSFLEIPLPIIKPEVQIIISQKVTESFRLKKQSEQLLEIAKTAVEMAIEMSEGEALGWMEKETKKLNLKK